MMRDGSGEHPKDGSTDDTCASDTVCVTSGSTLVVSTVDTALWAVPCRARALGRETVS